LYDLIRSSSDFSTWVPSFQEKIEQLDDNITEIDQDNPMQMAHMENEIEVLKNQLVVAAPRGYFGGLSPPRIFFKSF